MRSTHRRRTVALACALVLVILSQETPAEPLWKRLLPGKRIEADPSRDYVLAEENGPWLIMATTFSGEGAEEQARELVLEMRRRYKLESYMHEMTFDFSHSVKGRGVDRFGQPQRMRYRRDKEIREIAVLVGNYKSVQDPEAQEVLHKIKYMRPYALDPDRLEKTSQTLAALRTIQTALLPEGDERKEKGPMGKAFISRNPLLPAEYFSAPGVDRFVEKINSDVKYSLLDCRGKYTVKVATFTGQVVIDQNEIREYEQGKRLKSRLAEAGEKAEKLTLALREKGYDAYTYHDRKSSIVTVGSFQSAGTPNADGKIVINPQIHAIMKTFRAGPLQPGQVTGGPAGYKPKVLIGIPLDIQPQVYQVPRRALVRDERR